MVKIDTLLNQSSQHIQNLDNHTKDHHTIKRVNEEADVSFEMSDLMKTFYEEISKFNHHTSEIEKLSKANGYMNAIRGSQWTAFDHYLDKSGVYDNMSDSKRQKVKQVLSDVTLITDSLHSGNDLLNQDVVRHKLNFVNLDSSIVKMGLEHAVIALGKIGDTLIPEDKRDGFDALIREYRLSNESYIMNYKSMNEKMQNFRSKYYDQITQIMYSSEQNVDKGMEKLELSRLLTRIGKGKANSQSPGQIFAEVFKELLDDEASIVSVLAKVQESLESQNKGEHNNDRISEYVNRISSESFDHIEKTWEDLRLTIKLE